MKCVQAVSKANKTLSLLRDLFAAIHKHKNFAYDFRKYYVCNIIIYFYNF